MRSVHEINLPKLDETFGAKLEKAKVKIARKARGKAGANVVILSVNY